MPYTDHDNDMSRQGMDPSLEGKHSTHQLSKEVKDDDNDDDDDDDDENYHYFDDKQRKHYFLRGKYLDAN